VKWYKLVIFILISSALFTCGIDEYYYLEQVPEWAITTSADTIADINIPPLPQYATGYSIYYRIYISDQQSSGTITTEEQRNRIHPNLSADYKKLEPYTNPVNNALVIGANTFSNFKYYELKFDPNFLFPPGTLRLEFLESPKTATANGHDLLRSEQNTMPDRNFFYSQDLNKSEYSSNNADVDRNNSEGYAYVSMYIVARGVNPTNFNAIFSKPTHISIFILP